MWMQREMKSKITKDNLLQLKEKKINQLRVNKIKLNKKLEGFKRRNANKWFDNNEGKFYDHCRTIIKNDPVNKRPTYTEPINDNNQTSDTELTKNDFEQFWRPIWEENKETNLDAKWIKEVKEAINEVIPPPSDDLITIQESDIKSSICSKKNWSSPGVDKITNYWMKKITEAHEGLAIALTKIINNEQSLPQWLCEGKCIMIPKTENPKAKDHRPITLLNTMYKLVTSVIDARLRKHQEQYNYMQIDQR